ncbi:hypothetical protein OS493_010092 [Desmophyllum pertusum]|uniref:Uncharacterized protein n=1 Tax=Desmophyllum pertusum TaxID=174260 RepID=A0A9X0CFE0_9CNID|nr:hypothetical protein OS493_010092 [Desmophyllum pertusum]
MSLKMQRSTSGTEKPSVRSATLPKPWSPAQAPSSLLSRKLSWEMPKVGDEDYVRSARKERSGSSAEEPIPEVSEELSQKRTYLILSLYGAIINISERKTKLISLNLGA